MKKPKTLSEILSKLSTKELIQLANEINSDTIPMDALCRKVIAESYPDGVNTMALLYIVSIGPALSLELSNRIK